MRKFQKFFLHGGRQWSLIMERSCVSSLPAADYCLRSAARRLISLIALALKLDEDYFVKVGALDDPEGFLRLLHYPGELGSSDEEPIYGASAHSDYGMTTLLLTDGVAGLQACPSYRALPDSRSVGRSGDNLGSGKMYHRYMGEFTIAKRIYASVLCFIVNIGDMMERWTNCLFR
ncbi:unnamed protein product [Linum tenue]|uniref:Uncharacterized protein n=1 Tax=Linum tenue TaxID=586396 RepID=A0AAV0JV43_9ROSI|nr:unnamed protein product [Linum tenue]